MRAATKSEGGGGAPSASRGAYQRSLCTKVQTFQLYKYDSWAGSPAVGGIVS